MSITICALGLVTAIMAGIVIRATAIPEDEGIPVVYGMSFQILALVWIALVLGLCLKAISVTVLKLACQIVVLRQTLG